VLKNFTRDIMLAMQAKSGLNSVWFVCVAVALFAALTTFVFLCVAGFDWLLPQFGAVYAALIMAGGFAVVALIGIAAAAISRQRTRARAIAERAAHAQAASAMLLDPQILNVVMRAGRSIGWTRVAPIVVLGFIAAQWFSRRHSHSDENEAG
jgi:hypothetical protein